MYVLEKYAGRRVGKTANASHTYMYWLRGQEIEWLFAADPKIIGAGMNASCMFRSTHTECKEQQQQGCMQAVSIAQWYVVLLSLASF